MHSKQAGLRALDSGGFALSGHLDFDTTASVLEQSRALFASQGAVRLSLAEVSYANSAALALLIEWQRWAEQGSIGSIVFEQLPENLLKLAQVSELETVLSLA